MTRSAHRPLAWTLACVTLAPVAGAREQGPAPAPGLVRFIAADTTRGGEVRAIARDADGFPWVGTAEGVVYHDGVTWRSVFGLPPHVAVTSFAVRPREVLMGTAAGVYRTSGTRAERVSGFSGETFLAGGSAGAWAAADGALWRREDGGAWTRTEPPPLGAPRPRSLVVAGGQPCLLADDGRTRCRRDGRWDDVPVAGRVTAVGATADGTALLAGTAAGEVFRGGAPAGPVQPIGHVGGPVTAIAEDGGQIWIGTAAGAWRLDARTGTATRVGGVDGAVSALCPPRPDAPALWIGTTGGDLLALDLWPRAAGTGDVAPGPPDRPARLAWRVSMAGGDIWDPATEPVLAHDRNLVVLRYALLQEPPASGVQYRTTLRGPVSDDAGWRAEAQRTVGRLTGGAYEFSVWARDARGRTFGPLQATFRVRPAPWRTAWAYLAYAGTVALVGYLWLGRRHAARRERDRVRELIAADLHDDVGATLTGLALSGEVALRKLDEKDLAAAEEALRRTVSLAREAREAVGDAVWASDPRRDSLADLAQRAHYHAAETLSAAGIELRFEGPPAGVLPMNAYERRQAYLMVKEAVSNVVRHSGATEATVRLAVEGRALVLEIADDGRGLDAARGAGHGLSSMRERAARLGGTLTVDSPGRGTRVRARLPLSRRR